LPNLRRAKSAFRQSVFDYKKSLILDAAAYVFATNGHSAANTTDISERAGMTQSNLYNYFASKDEMLEAICRIAMDGYLERIHGVLVLDCPIRKRVTHAILSHFETLNEKPDHYLTFLTCRQFLPGPARHRIGARAREYEALLEKMFVDAVARGELAKVENPAFIVSSLLALCNNIAISRKTGLGYGLEALAGKITSMVFAGGIELPA
jgi:AcrR family transcriptional regulator